MVDVLYPRSAPATGLDELLAERTTHTRHPFDEGTIAFLDGLAKRLFALSRAEPALAPLAFFLRRANLRALATRAESIAADRGVVVPQGAVFHVPPTNVDTLFLYTLAITMLTGNANIVRISPNAGPATYTVLDHLLNALDEHPEVGAGLTIVRFGRDQELLELCSSVADMRMVWGGDVAVRSIRQAALPPRAKELTFPDRVSIGAVDVAAWAGANGDERTAVAEGLYNDVFWFDQMACSSPTQLVLVGEQTAAAEAADQIAAALDAVAASRYEAVDGQAINKMVSLVSGLDRGLGRFRWLSNSLVTVEAADLATAVEFRPGGGFLSVQHVDLLTALLPQLSRRVQTLSVFGFTTQELMQFARAANGRGIDRIVPIGHALDFDAVWDGKDLIAESLRLVTVA